MRQDPGGWAMNTTFLSSRRYVEQLERWRIGGVEKQERLRYANTQVSTMGLASGMWTVDRTRRECWEWADIDGLDEVQQVRGIRRQVIVILWMWVLMTAVTEAIVWHYPLPPGAAPDAITRRWGRSRPLGAGRLGQFRWNSSRSVFEGAFTPDANEGLRAN